MASMNSQPVEVSVPLIHPCFRPGNILASAFFTNMPVAAMGPVAHCLEFAHNVSVTRRTSGKLLVVAHSHQPMDIVDIRVGYLKFSR
jgi:hypothetical protein